MMTDDCSIWAYNDIRESGLLGERKSQYLSVFIDSIYPLTHLQATNLVAKRFNIMAGKISTGSGSRLSELEREGFLVKAFKVKCEITGQTVNTWRWTSRKNKLKRVSKILTCPNCKGSGKVKMMVTEK